MQKYCLTQCAKTKLQQFKSDVISLVSIIFATFVIATAIISIVFIIGILSQLISLTIYGYINYPISAMGAGLLTIIVSMFGIFVVIGTYATLKLILLPIIEITDTALNKLAGADSSNCKIFERCD